MKTKGNDDILAQADRRSGMTVPEGYFSAFAEKMITTLPPNDAAENPKFTEPLGRRSLWQRVRPFVYLAAMFAGIWCTMKVFSLMQPTDVDLGFEGNRVISEALADDSFIYDYVSSHINENELLDEMYDQGIDVDALIAEDSDLILLPDDSLQ